MILADTCIWADHIDRSDADLMALLEAGEVMMHPFVIGEIMLGNLVDRQKWHHLLSCLPEFLPVRHTDVMTLVETGALFGSGIGYVDAHLCASVLTMPNTMLWTRDKRLHRVAERLGIAAIVG
jgi:predicted nucleic acid-binding protein